MHNTPDWADGARYLRENAPELIPMINKYPECNLKPEPQSKYFTILVNGIVSQQLPPDVSLVLLKKLEDLLGSPLVPEAVLSISDEKLIEIGLVTQKITYLKDFATAVVEKKVTFAKFSEMSDAEITKQLVNIRGLGQWTIEMFLLLALCRTNIVPSADFIFKKELKELMNLSEIPKRGQINKVTENWRPWRSLGVWYLWQAAGDK